LFWKNYGPGGDSGFPKTDPDKTVAVDFIKDLILGK
jgi:hypothetical protein